MARLSQLKSIVAELEKQNFNFDGLPENSSIKAYREWASDPEKRERPDGSITASGEKSYIGLEAFGLPSPDDKTRFKVGSRAMTKATALGLAKFGLETVTNDHLRRNGFTPARCIVGLKKAPGQRERSDITRRYYRPRINGTWTIPMGKIGTKFEFEVQSDIASDTSIVNTHVVTFTPERIRRR